MEYRLVRRVLRRVGYHVVRADYYSPIPDVDAIPERVWSTPAAMPALRFDLDEQLDFVLTKLAPYLREFSPPADGPGNAEGFHLENPFYGSLDAEILYAMVRSLAPRRVVEIGAGYSTLVIVAAARRNAQGGAPIRHEVYDPYPSAVLERVRDRIELSTTSAADLPAATLLSLAAGDILVIDTTHTLKPGGEVVRLLLELLPQLAPGVVVHVHDFFRPFEYPRILLEHYGVFWQEHYLLQAFLAHNEVWDVLCANHALARLRAHAIQALVPSLTPQAQPSSLWIRRASS